MGLMSAHGVTTHGKAGAPRYASTLEAERALPTADGKALTSQTVRPELSR